jgi:hypothetical protein
MLLDFNLAASTIDAPKGDPPCHGQRHPAVHGPEHLDAFNLRGTTPPEAVDERADICSSAVLLRCSPASAPPPRPRDFGPGLDPSPDRGPPPHRAPGPVSACPRVSPTPGGQVQVRSGALRRLVTSRRPALVPGKPAHEALL